MPPSTSVRAAISALPPMLWPIARRLPSYVRLGWALAKDPAIPKRHKAILIASAIYTLSPAQFAVGMVPVVGQIDTLALFLWGLRIALRHCPPEHRDRILHRVHLPQEQVDEDLDRLFHAGAKVARAAYGQIASAFGFGGKVGAGFARRQVSRLIGKRESAAVYAERY